MAENRIDGLGACDRVDVRLVALQAMGCIPQSKTTHRASATHCRELAVSCIPSRFHGGAVADLRAAISHSSSSPERYCLFAPVD
eukprot:3112572-Rhodomonas_salina.2